MNKLCNILTIASLTIALLLALSALAASDAGADVGAELRLCGVSEPFLDQTHASVESGVLKSVDEATLLGALAEVCRTGLPVAPFEDKVAEGLAKRVPSIRIKIALTAMQQHYLEASDILSAVGRDSHDLIVVVGDGMVKGTPASDFRSYVNSYSDQPEQAFGVGLSMISYLGQSSFDYLLSDSILSSGFQTATLSTEWRYLVRVVLIARQRGISDVDVAKSAQKVLSAGGSLADVAADLGFTLRSMSGRSYSN